MGLHMAIDSISSVENALVDIYHNKGFVFEDEVIDCCTDHGLKLAEIDLVCDRLLKRSIIIRDDNNEYEEESDVNDDSVYDRQHIDYASFLSDIKRLYPSCESLIENMRGIMPPQHKEWKSLIGEAKRGNKFAKDRLVLMYLRTIMKRAYDYSQTYYCDFEDCFQNAVMGFMNAFEKYDVTSPESFASYFQIWLIQFMNREFVIEGNVLRFPQHFKDSIMPSLNNIRKNPYGFDGLSYSELKIARKYEARECYEGIYKEIDLNFKRNYLEEYAALSCGEYDYNLILPYLPLYDDIPYEMDLDERVMMDVESKKLRKNVMECLTSREREVVFRRYGFYDGNCWTLEEIGDLFFVTRERVRQIEKKALRKLRSRYIKYKG